MEMQTTESLCVRESRMDWYSGLVAIPGEAEPRDRLMESALRMIASSMATM